MWWYWRGREAADLQYLLDKVLVGCVVFKTTVLWQTSWLFQLALQLAGRTRRLETVSFTLTPPAASDRKQEDVLGVNPADKTVNYFLVSL